MVRNPIRETEESRIEATGGDQVKGVQINGTLEFLRKRFGDDAVEAALEGLEPEARELLPATVLDSAWYSFEIWRPIRHISRALAPDLKGPELAIDMGKANAEYVFNGVYKRLMTDDPARLVEKFSWVHGYFYREAVTLSSRMTSLASCVLKYAYDDPRGPARSNCYAILGFWIRSLELAGGRRVSGDHTACVRSGDGYCEFSLEWDPPEKG